MYKNSLLAGVVFFVLSFSTSVLAESVCELPSDIDDGDSYWINFKNQKPIVYELKDIDDCWIQVQKPGDKYEYWYPITDIESITTVEKD